MFSQVKFFFRTLSSKRFRENPKAPQLTDADKRALLVGLINGEQITACYNSLATGMGRSHLRSQLYKWYGIVGPGAAVSTLDWFLDEGHRTIFNDIWPIVKTGADAEARQQAIYSLYNERFRQDAAQANDDAEINSIKESCEINYEKAVEFGNNLRELMDGKRGNDPFVAFNEKNIDKGILAWDMGRLVTVTRSAFDARYIDEQTAWDYIRKAWRLAAAEYSTWEEFATAYLIGRGMWGGDSFTLIGMYDFTEHCVKDENSPWKTITLK